MKDHRKLKSPVKATLDKGKRVEEWKAFLVWGEVREVKEIK